MAIIYTNTGQAHTIDCLDPATRGSQPATYYGAWGSGSTAPAVTQNALTTENAESRVACTISQQTTQSTGDTIRYVFEITATGNRTVNEAGVFTASTSGDMPIRLTLSTLNIETGDRTEFTVNHQQTDVSGI